MKRHFHIIWPESRVVTEQTVRGWFMDAQANCELDTALAVEAIDLDSVDLMAQALDDAGLITLGEHRDR